MSELAWEAFCVAVGRATTDADVNGEPMMLAVAHAQRVSGLEAEIERLHRELQMSCPDHCAENDRLRAALQEIITTDPATDPPEASSDWYQEWKGLAFRLKSIARRALEGEPTDAQLARYHGDVDGDAEL